MRLVLLHKSKSYLFIAEGHLIEVAFLLGQVNDLAYRAKGNGAAKPAEERRGSALQPAVANLPCSVGRAIEGVGGRRLACRLHGIYDGAVARDIAVLANGATGNEDRRSCKRAAPRGQPLCGAVREDSDGLVGQWRQRARIYIGHGISLILAGAAQGGADWGDG